MFLGFREHKVQKNLWTSASNTSFKKFVLIQSLEFRNYLKNFILEGDFLCQKLGY